jgi:4-diphosphocytidyl-2-C-methyl-D-erythritol kinase
LFQTIDLGDELELEITDGPIQITCTEPSLPVDHTNLAYRAAKLLQDKYNIKKGIRIHITKTIPIGAGLGGGSTDAAAVLRGCNRLWNLNLYPEDLEEIGSHIGMDVPFCIQGGTVLALERGDVLKQRIKTPEIWLVLVYPNLFVSTKTIYSQLDKNPPMRHKTISDALRSNSLDTVQTVAKYLFNRLEEVTLTLYPQIGIVKKQLTEAGCIGTLMSGSGSSVFGLCESQAQATKIAQKFEIDYGYWTRSLKTISQVS